MEVCKYNDSKEPFFQDQRGDRNASKREKKPKKKKRQSNNKYRTKIAESWQRASGMEICLEDQL